MESKLSQAIRTIVIASMATASINSIAQETQQQQQSVDLYGICERFIARSFDGSCNNVYNYRFGASEEQLKRTFPPAYVDGISQMVGSEAVASRKNPRQISNLVSTQTGDIPSVDKLNNLVYQWGQFIDHDIDLDHANDGRPEPVETFTIAQVFGDLFPEFIFSRSPFDQTVADTLPRQQVNHISSWLDASMVYGSSIERANWLRSLDKGRLKVSSTLNARGEEEILLPYGTLTGNLKDAAGNDVPLDPDAPRMEGDSDRSGKRIRGTFIAGDFRANEQTGLTSIHTAWVREHNRIAKQLWHTGYRDDEEIYQRARRLVIGKIQKITYDEWLPAMGINLPAYQGYKVT